MKKSSIIIKKLVHGSTVEMARINFFEATHTKNKAQPAQSPFFLQTFNHIKQT